MKNLKRVLSALTAVGVLLCSLSAPAAYAAAGDVYYEDGMDSFGLVYENVPQGSWTPAIYTFSDGGFTQETGGTVRFNYKARENGNSNQYANIYKNNITSAPVSGEVLFETKVLF